MLLQILTQTPPWVFILFVALLWLGVQQMAPRTMPLRRATLVPLAMAGLSLFGVIAAFKETPLALLAWLLGGVVVAAMAWWGPKALSAHLPALTQRGARLDLEGRRFHLPGSAMPLVLFMGIFWTKFAVGVSLATQPALHHNLVFALGASLLYGVFSGFFITRAFALWRLVMAQGQTAPATTLKTAA